MSYSVDRVPVTITLAGQEIPVGEIVRLPTSTMWRGRLFGFNGGEFFCSDHEFETVFAITLSKYEGPQDRVEIDPIAF